VAWLIGRHGCHLNERDHVAERRAYSCQHPRAGVVTAIRIGEVKKVK